MLTSTITDFVITPSSPQIICLIRVETYHVSFRVVLDLPAKVGE